MGASYWQSTHLSLCPPRAAVRQREDHRSICLQHLIADTGL
jgi:hypothetical protein